MIRVLLADDQALIRVGLRMLIDSAEDMEVAARPRTAPRRSGWPPRPARTSS